MLEYLLELMSHITKQDNITKIQKKIEALCVIKENIVPTNENRPTLWAAAVTTDRIPNIYAGCNALQISFGRQKYNWHPAGPEHRDDVLTLFQCLFKNNTETTSLQTNSAPSLDLFKQLTQDDLPSIEQIKEAINGEYANDLNQRFVNLIQEKIHELETQLNQAKDQSQQASKKLLIAGVGVGATVIAGTLLLASTNKQIKSQKTTTGLTTLGTLFIKICKGTCNSDTAAQQPALS